MSPFPLKIRGVAKAEITTRVRQALDSVQLARFASRMPRQLSGGQQQRVALARALVFQPDLLLLDEPLSALDRNLRLDMQTELKDLHERVGLTFIYVTHDQQEALSMSDEIAILRDGRLIQQAAPATLYERPATRFVAEFLGRSNFLPGRVETVAADGFSYRCGPHLLHQAGAGPAGGRGGAGDVAPGEASYGGRGAGQPPARPRRRVQLFGRHHANPGGCGWRRADRPVPAELAGQSRRTRRSDRARLGP